MSGTRVSGMWGFFIIYGNYESGQWKKRLLFADEESSISDLKK